MFWVSYFWELKLYYQAHPLRLTSSTSTPAKGQTTALISLSPLPVNRPPNHSMAGPFKPMWEGFAQAFTEPGAPEAPPNMDVPPMVWPYSPLILLTYVGTYFFLHRFGGFKRRLQFLASLVQSLMVGIPVTSSLTGFDLSALLYKMAIPVL